MRVRLWLLCSLLVAAAGCRDSGQRAPTLPVAATETRPDAELVVAPASAEPSAATVRETLAARRARAIERLRAYRVARAYPTDAAGMPLGVFRDDAGVRCPMSELIFRAGRADLVDAVVRLDNDLKLADVHGGPLLDWMLQSGLTQEEIIEIQGVMEWGEMQRQIPLELQGPQGDVQITRSIDRREQARDLVDEKLIAAERKLRAGTAASLATAVDRLGERRRQVLAATSGDAAATPAVAAR